MGEGRKRGRKNVGKEKGKVIRTKRERRRQWRKMIQKR